MLLLQITNLYLEHNCTMAICIIWKTSYAGVPMLTSSSSLLSESCDVIGLLDSALSQMAARRGGEFYMGLLRPCK